MSPRVPGFVLESAPRTVLVALGLLLGVASACAAPATSTTPTPSSAAVSTGAYIPTPVPSSSEPPRTAGAEPVASTASIPTAALPTAEFISGDRVLARLPVEVLPEGEFSVGLSGRRELGERGMLFDYHRPGIDGPLWMKDTHIDLDIAFIDGNQVIVSIRTMRAESLDYVYSSAPYRSAIEAPAGWYGARGVTEGATVRYVPPGTPRP